MYHIISYHFIFFWFQLIKDKVNFALTSGLKLIPCVGEKLDEREAGKTKEVVEKQMNAIKGKDSILSMILKNTNGKVLFFLFYAI